MNSVELSSVTIDLARTDEVDQRRINVEWAGCLLHGFGATANDLVPLAPLIGVASSWEFPHAPVPITVAGMSYGRAWFPREEEHLQQALFGTYFQNLRAMEPDGLAAAAHGVRALLEKRHVSWNHLILGGFSQGAMVVAEILRQGAKDERLPLPAAALLFSGALIAQGWWDGTSSRANNTIVDTHLQPGDVLVFQSHGTDDAILPFSEGLALSRMLESTGFPVTLVEFDGGHEIPQSVVTHAAGLLTERFM